MCIVLAVGFVSALPVQHIQREDSRHLKFRLVADEGHLDVLAGRPTLRVGV